MHGSQKLYTKEKKITHSENTARVSLILFLSIHIVIVLSFCLSTYPAILATSALSYQLSVISNQQSGISQQLSAIGYQLLSITFADIISLWLYSGYCLYFVYSIFRNCLLIHTYYKTIILAFIPYKIKFHQCTQKNKINRARTINLFHRIKIDLYRQTSISVDFYTIGK